MNRISLWRIVLTIALFLPALMATPASASKAAEVRVYTSVNGAPYYDACYRFGDYSNIGCDENRDGMVTFKDMPSGNWTLYQTANIPYTMVGQNADGGLNVTIVSGNISEIWVQLTPTTNESGRTFTTDVHLVTRDPETGKSLTGVCYELVGYSNIGCDENKDGHVTFADIPAGDYTIRQTTTPSGYPAMDDYKVVVGPTVPEYKGPLTILLSQSKVQAPKDQMNVSVIFYDRTTGMRVENVANCAQLRFEGKSISNVGCDDDVIDGQVDFMRVPLAIDQPGLGLGANIACPYVLPQNASFQEQWLGGHTKNIYVPLDRTTSGCN